MKLTVAEFRKNIKLALDTVVRGEPVEIDRMGQRFIIMLVPRGVEVSIGNYQLEERIKEAWGDKKIPAVPSYSSEDGVVPMAEAPILGMREPPMQRPAHQKVCEHGYSYQLCKFEKCRKKAK